MPPPRKRRKKAAEAASRGLAAADLASGSPSPEASALRAAVEADGGLPLSPLPRPARRALAAPRRAADRPRRAHAVPARPLGGARRAARARDRRARTVPRPDHRRAHGRRAGTGRRTATTGSPRCGARARKSIVALVVPETEVAYQILALNTEKAHNLREKALEVIRMARELAGRGDAAPETQYALEFEEAALPHPRRLLREERPVSRRRLPSRPQARGRVPGGAARRGARNPRGARRALLELDEAVTDGDARARRSAASRARTCAPSSSRGSTRSASTRGDKPSFDATLDKMIGAAKKFKPESVKAEHVARAAGAPEETAS